MSDNPFLLPPGANTPSTREPLAVPDATPTPDPAHYIAIPASVESATHRIARPESESFAEKTHIASVPNRGWELLLQSGRRLALAGPTVLGRDPARIPERPGATLITLDDPGKTVSKTHALLEPIPEGVRVRELHSTNGIAIETAENRRVLEPGGEGNALAGSRVSLGSFVIVVVAL